jgi:hypothetical protein
LTDIETLLAIEEIKGLKARYFRYVDTKDWAGFEGLFSPDAVFDISDDVPGCIVIGAARIAETASKPLAGVVSVHHGHCPEIEIVTDTTARGIWAMEDTLRWPDEPDAPLRSLHGWGHYLETYERVAGRWYIKTMKLRRLRVDHERRS